MALLSKSAQAAVSGGGAYLSPSKIAAGSSVRFALLSDEPLEFYEVWAEGPDGKSKPFRFALLSDEPLEFYEVWAEGPDGKAKPFRFVSEPSPDDLTLAFGDFTRRMNREGTGPEPIKFALALPIYNHDAAQVQILQLAQKSIIRELDAVSQMPDYDDLTAIDFSLGKEGSGLKTEYKVTPLPRRKGADKDITAAWEEARADGFDISRLLEGGNPFKPEAP